MSRSAAGRCNFSLIASIFDLFGVVLRTNFVKFHTTIVKLHTNFIRIIANIMVKKVPIIIHIMKVRALRGCGQFGCAVTAPAKKVSGLRVGRKSWLVVLTQCDLQAWSDCPSG